MKIKSFVWIVAALCLFSNVASANNNYYIVSPAPIGYYAPPPQPVYWIPVAPVPVVPIVLNPQPMQPVWVAPPAIVFPPQVIMIDNRWQQRRCCLPIVLPRY